MAGMRKERRRDSLAFWALALSGGVALYALMGEQEAGASTLGWVQYMGRVGDEVKIVGFAAMSIAIVVAGIETFMHRGLDRLGITLASIGVGGGLVGGGGSLAGGLASGAPLLAAPDHVIHLAEALSNTGAGVLPWVVFGTLGMALWLTGRRYARA